MFAKKSVDSVLATFNRTIADLNAVAQEQAAEAETKRIEAEQAQAAALAADAEASRARNVAAKLESVINGDIATVDEGQTASVRDLKLA